MADVCELPSSLGHGEFEQIYNDMLDDKYWYSFFARPCCPAPGFKAACDVLDRLIEDTKRREDFTKEQKAQLVELMESRKDWYFNSWIYQRTLKK